MKNWLNLLVGAVAAAVSLGAHAAMIRYRDVDEMNVITIEGRITRGDSASFDQIIAQMPKRRTVVALNSFGGIVREGVSIGETIRANGYGTLVLEGTTCASTCGLIWLAGSKRFTTPNSNIGFHAAYLSTSGAESGQANALVGAYLNRLGLSDNAIAYVTAAPPREMSWLTATDANRLGITYAMLPVVETTRKTGRLVATDQSTGLSQGRQARIDYDQWLAKQTGEFREGASFWTSHRADTPQPICTIRDSPDWRAGCVAARARLTVADIRRRNDGDYARGWDGH